MLLKKSNRAVSDFILFYESENIHIENILLKKINVQKTQNKSGS